MTEPIWYVFPAVDGGTPLEMTSKARQEGRAYVIGDEETAEIRAHELAVRTGIDHYVTCVQTTLRVTKDQRYIR